MPVVREASKVQIAQARLAGFPVLVDSVATWRRALTESEWTPWVIVGLAAFLRFFLLGIKPPHFDEGINGWFVDQLLKTGFYRYDPTNYHGPLHFYVLLLSETLFGRNLIALRLPVVLVSIGCVWLILKFEPFVGRTASRLAALAMAVSPGFVFYGRYSIHEVWILFFTMLFVFGLFGLWKVGTAKYLWCAGMGLTGMILSKETYVLHVLCAIIAVPVCAISNYFSEIQDRRRAEQSWNLVDLAVVIGTGVALIVAFYSGFFFHWNGVKDLFAAFKPWFETGKQGHGHEKAWYYWIALIGNYELPALAGLITCLFALRFKSAIMRYLAIYGVGMLMAYSIVKYKTPWCIISFIWPFLFVFGAMSEMAPVRFKGVTYRWFGLVVFGAVLAAVLYSVTAEWPSTWDHMWPYWLAGGLAVLLLVLIDRAMSEIFGALLILWSFGHCIWLNYFRCTTDTEPYVYVQTYNDIYKFTDPIMRLAHADPRAYQLVGHIIRPSPYPLPWILGDFGRVGYYEKDNMPDPVEADFLLVQQDKIQTVESKLHDSYYTVPVTVRPYQDPSKAYFSAKIFKSFFPGKAPDFKGAPANPNPSPSPAPTATPNQ